MDPEEILELVNEEGLVIGQALRSEVHGNPSLIHRVVHVLVVNGKGTISSCRRGRCRRMLPQGNGIPRSGVMCVPERTL